MNAGLQTLRVRMADALSAAVQATVDGVVLNCASPILQHEVIRDGIRLYEASAMERRLFEVCSFRDSTDARCFRDLRSGRMD